MKRDFLSTSAGIALAMALAIGSGAAIAQEAGTTETTGETGTTVAPATAVAAEELLGRTIENPDGENIGEIKNVVIDQAGQAKYVIVGVGGFLGLGENHVALAWDELTIADNGETVTSAVTKEQLEALPEHKFPSEVRTGTVYSYEEDIKVNPNMADRDVTSTDQPPVTTGEQTTALETTPAAGAMGIGASRLVGADVTNAQGERIGEINEVVLGSDGAAQGLVIDVGGFLGVGERRVLVDWSDVTIRSQENGTLDVATAMDKAGLESLPEHILPSVQQ
jgi:sporulation protein YlmC with PRC-barrel domain